MKKRVEEAGCVLLMVALLGLFACGGEEERAAKKVQIDLEQLDPEGQEVVFWYQHTREREEALLQLIEAFNRDNPYGFMVKGEYAGKYNDIYNKMIVGLQGGTLPNLVVAYQNQARAYYQADGIVDLTPYMDSPRWGLSEAEKRDYFEAFLQQDHIDGVQTGLPPNRSLEVLYYNIDWLRELGYEGPPRTWSEFAEMCRKAKMQPFSQSEDKKRSLGFLLEIDASRLASMVFSRGGNFVDATKTTYTLDSPEMRAALGLMVELMAEGAVDLVSEAYGDQKEFSVGQVLFALRSSSGLPFFRSAVESGLGFEWDVTHPPYEGSRPVVNAYGASVSVGQTTPEAQLAAWLFAKWFTEPEQQARWARASNYFPVRKSTAKELDDYFADNPRYKSAFGLLKYGKSEPSMAGYQQVRRLIQDTMVDVTDGTDMDQVLKKLEQDANRTLEDYQ